MTTATVHSYFDSASGAILDSWFPPEGIEPKRFCLAERAGLIVGRGHEVELAGLDEAPASAGDVYYRLHLLSRCEVAPNEVNLEGIFGLLPTIAWT